MKTAGEFLDALSAEIAAGRIHVSKQEDLSPIPDNESVMNLGMSHLDLIETFINKVYFERMMDT